MVEVVEEEEVKQADGTVKVVRKSGPTPEQTVRAALDDAGTAAEAEPPRRPRLQQRLQATPERNRRRL
ncbi:MAG: hypothetical protein VXW84_15405, partial [Verrucomicrobiota bacterium]|nr:hypothetical protein [Verrucomicrobiota bacterium]